MSRSADPSPSIYLRPFCEKAASNVALICSSVSLLIGSSLLRVISAAAGDQLSTSEADLEALSSRGGGWFKASSCGPEQQSREGGRVAESGLATGAGQVQRRDRGALRSHLGRRTLGQ